MRGFWGRVHVIASSGAIVRSWFALWASDFVGAEVRREEVWQQILLEQESGRQFSLSGGLTAMHGTAGNRAVATAKEPTTSSEANVLLSTLGL